MTTKTETNQTEMGAIYNDGRPDAKFPNGRTFLVLPTPYGHNRRAFMDAKEAQEQKDALVVTDPALASAFRYTAGPVVLEAEDLFEVAGSTATHSVVDLKADGYKVSAKEAITAIPNPTVISAHYSKPKHIKAWLKFGDIVKVGRRFFRIEKGGNSDWVKMTPISAKEAR